MNKIVQNLEKYWFGFDLGEYRDCAGTYEPYPYESLPKLNINFDEHFKWLEEAPNQEAGNIIKNKEVALKIKFPKDFALFMGSTNASQQIFDSPTACYFVEDLDVQSFLSGYLVEFYCDQQDCVHWLLYFECDENECTEAVVLASPAPVDALIDEITESELNRYLCFSEYSFEAFMYRLHMENLLWFSLDGNSIPAEWQIAADNYLQHYTTTA